ncbi:Bug family tripartite tricarboxylate transporter substrate binding protein [Parvibium lacunae]|uniref:Tripartite tricarboxylate transporter substrate binding protein n=1 Tax=Parvibium lacunae TaxID=1888893 RepID=A0A368L0K2_9BURK|nr:tripartite tricarboxylate transporter substrate binding protein [Parvibium lacunae]RCS57091.1 tripartite tricarboxylate transporter substrate binding protein [Parvibium lacunae]
MLKTLFAAILITLAHYPTLTAASEAYPTKPIKFIVPYPPGGPLDTTARILADKLRDSLAQPVIVENRPGAGGNIGADQVAKANADGYTIGIGAVATHAINPSLFAKMPYNAQKDFTPLSLIAQVPNVLVMNTEVATKLNIRTAQDLIQYARANPGRLNYASGGNGSGGHLAGELFKAAAKVSAVHIPYQGASPAQLGLIAGQTDFMFDNLASANANIQAGKLKPLAVTSAQRQAGLDVPSLQELGFSGLEINTWWGVFAPANLPPVITQRLVTEIHKALAQPDLKERFAKLGASPSPMAPDAFARFIQQEATKYAKVIQSAGIKPD